MADQIPMIIGDERVASDESIEVRSPFDGSIVGTVAKGTEEHLDQAVAIAAALHRAGPLPAHERAAVLDRAARLLAERVEEFATVISAEAAKPIKTARVEAARAVDTVSFSAAVARTLGGELIPLDASSAGEGKVGWVKRVPIGVVAGISPFNFPLNLVCHKVAPAIAAGCPVVLKPASATPLSALKLAELLIDECGLPPGLAERRPLRRVHRQPPGRAPRRGHDHLHRLTAGRLGHPGPGRHQEGRPGAGQQRPGRHRARRGLGDRGGQDQGGGVQPRRPVLHLDPAGLRPRGHRRGVHRRPRQGGRGPGRG